MNKSRIRGAVAAVVALAGGSAWAANLSHNLASTLTLTGAASYDNVSVGVTGGTASTIVNATGTTSFTANGATIYVGVNLGNTTSVGKLDLGPNNNLTASTRLVIGGNQPDSDNSSNHSGTITTATSSTTTIATPYMAVGTSKGTGNFTLGSNATLNLGSSGSRTELIISRSDTGNGYNRPGNGTMNLSGGIANLTLSSLTIARKTVGGNSENNYTGTGTLTLSSNSANHLDISGAGNVVRVGYSTVAYMGPRGTLTIGNLDATSSITSTDNSTAILLGYHVGAMGTTVTSGTMNFNGGTLTINTTGAAIAGGGGGATSNLNLSGGAKLIAGSDSSNWIHSLTSATVGTGGATIDTNGKTIGVSQAFTGAGGLIKDGAGTMTLSGTQGYTGATEIKAGELSLAGSLHANSAVTVRSGAAISGTGTVNGSLHFDSGAKLRFLNDNEFDYFAVTGNVTFGGFGVGDILGFDSASAVLNTPYTLIAGNNISFTNVSNTTPETAYDFGNGRKGYFQSGSLQLIVIPEPATFGVVLGVLAAAVIRRRRFG